MQVLEKQHIPRIQSPQMNLISKQHNRIKQIPQVIPNKAARMQNINAGAKKFLNDIGGQFSSSPQQTCGDIYGGGVRLLELLPDQIGLCHYVVRLGNSFCKCALSKDEQTSAESIKLPNVRNDDSMKSRDRTQQTAPCVKIISKESKNVNQIVNSNSRTENSVYKQSRNSAYFSIQQYNKQSNNYVGEPVNEKEVSILLERVGKMSTTTVNKQGNTVEYSNDKLSNYYNVEATKGSRKAVPSNVYISDLNNQYEYKKIGRKPMQSSHRPINAKSNAINSENNNIVNYGLISTNDDVYNSHGFNGSLMDNSIETSNTNINLASQISNEYDSSISKIRSKSQTVRFKRTSTSAQKLKQLNNNPTNNPDPTHTPISRPSPNSNNSNEKGTAEPTTRKQPVSPTYNHQYGINKVQHILKEKVATIKQLQSKVIQYNNQINQLKDHVKLKDKEISDKNQQICKLNCIINDYRHKFMKMQQQKYSSTDNHIHLNIINPSKQIQNQTCLSPRTEGIQFLKPPTSSASLGESPSKINLSISINKSNIEAYIEQNIAQIEKSVEAFINELSFDMDNSKVIQSLQQAIKYKDIEIAMLKRMNYLSQQQIIAKDRQLRTVRVELRDVKFKVTKRLESQKQYNDRIIDQDKTDFSLEISVQ